MSRRSIITIIVGLLVFAATLLVSNWVIISRMEALPSGGLDPQTRVEQLQLTETIQTSFLFIEVVELMLTGLLAFIASYISSLLDVFVFDVYGGMGSRALACTGIPAGFFGILGGVAWYMLRRRSGIARYDLLLLIMIGILAGLIPGACVKLLPQ